MSRASAKNFYYKTIVTHPEDYEIVINELKNNETYEEIYNFNKWRDEFNGYCAQRNLLSRLGFIEFFKEKQREHKIINGQEIFIAGFDNKTYIYLLTYFL